MATIAAKFRFLVVVGVGFFGDGWFNSTIGLVVPMLGYLYFQDKNGSMPTVLNNAVKASFSIGMVVGQILFGVFGDAIGRRFVYGKELICTIIGAFMVIMMPWGDFSHRSVVAWMCCFRMLTGVGAGGDYPMSATIAAEGDKSHSRSKMVLSIFASGSLGYMAAGIVYLILLVAFKHSVEDNIDRLQWVWRLLFGIGLIPLVSTLYARLTMPESKPYQKYVGEASLEKRGLTEQWRDFRQYFSVWKHARTLFATCIIWFLFDIAFYGVNLNQSTVLADIGWASGSTKWEVLYNTAVGNLIVGCAGYVPGYYVGIFLPDLIGHRNQQMLGCVVCTILYAVWAGVSDHASTGGLVTLFTLSQFFLNAGLASTTFLIPVEAFPTRVRGTAHGLSAACGKLGAILTAMAFGTMTDKIGIGRSLGLFAGIMTLCGVLTLLIPETKGRSLDEIERGVMYGEDVERDNGDDMLSVKMQGKCASEMETAA